MVLQPSFLKPLHKASELRTKICIYACQHSSNVPNYRHNKKQVQPFHELYKKEHSIYFLLLHSAPIEIESPPPNSHIFVIILLNASYIMRHQNRAIKNQRGPLPPYPTMALLANHSEDTPNVPKKILWVVLKINEFV